MMYAMAYHILFNIINPFSVSHLLKAANSVDADSFLYGTVNHITDNREAGEMFGQLYLDIRAHAWWRVVGDIVDSAGILK